MELPIPETWKQLWDKWDLRAFIILSLSLQTLLILFAPLRKRTARAWLIMPIWSAYLLADWAANFAVGLISNSQGNSSRGRQPQHNDYDNEDLLAFWAPFLLVHLGGPDTITAFALEDNELWLRHLLGLVFQSLAAFYIFFQSLPKNKLWIPTMLMFISGIIKYSERTRSLYLASLDSFRDSMLTEPDPGPNYAKLMDEYYSKKEAKLPTRIQMIGEPVGGNKPSSRVKEGRLTDLEVVLYAHRFFQTFKGLIVDLIFSFRERNQSRDFFLKRTAKDAFRVVEVELNFIYEVLFTKVSVMYTTLGYIGRAISIVCTVVSLVLFNFERKKNKFNRFDVGITFTLLFGAISLDIIAIIMLIFSDWAVVAMRKLPEVAPEENLGTTQASQQGNGASKELKRSSIRRFFGRLKHVLSRRWSESVSTYNLINYCLNPRPEVKEKFIGYIGLSNFLDEMKYVRKRPFTEELRDHIFTELSIKSEIADDLDTAKEVSSARGDWILRVEGFNELLPYISQVDYDQSLLLWHIATELCYNDEIASNKDKDHPNNYREFSKLLSDYMIYLLVMQPTMMSAVTGIGQIRFRDTCAEAKKFFARENQKIRKREPNCFEVIFYVILSLFKYSFLCLYGFILSLIIIITSPLWIVLEISKYICGWKMVDGILSKANQYNDTILALCGKGKVKQMEEHIEACEKILAVNTEVRPVAVKGDRSKSVLFDGCILAKELRDLEKSDDEAKKVDKWEIMSKVWVELLSYAATHCRSNTHAQQLSKGGELITFVWLLMAHFGLGNQFQISEGHARAKLIVGK